MAQTVRALVSKSIGREFESHHGLTFFLTKKTEACPELPQYVIIATVSSGLKRSVTGARGSTLFGRRLEHGVWSFVISLLATRGVVLFVWAVQLRVRVRVDQHKG